MNCVNIRMHGAVIKISITVYSLFTSAVACWRPLLTNPQSKQYSRLVGEVWRRCFT